MKSKNEMVRLLGNDKFMMREIEEVKKLKHESGIMEELCSEVRLELIKKRKIEYFVGRRREIQQEVKRLKTAVRSK